MVPTFCTKCGAKLPAAGACTACATAALATPDGDAPQGPPNGAQQPPPIPPERARLAQTNGLDLAAKFDVQ